jgi:hypothetical protein
MPPPAGSVGRIKNRPSVFSALRHYLRHDEASLADVHECLYVNIMSHLMRSPTLVPCR